MEKKNKYGKGGKKEREKKKHTEGGKKEWVLNLSFIFKRETRNLKTYTQHSNLFDEA